MEAELVAEAGRAWEVVPGRGKGKEFVWPVGWAELEEGQGCSPG